MDIIKVSLDVESCWAKPTGTKVAQISKRIGSSVKELCSPQDVQRFISSVGSGLRTFCPATFREGIRDKEHFEQQQAFALDFDNKNSKNKVSFEQVKARADLYDLPMLFAYDTLSSVNHNRFRIVFLNDNPVTDIRVSELVLKGLTTIFPEADPCSKSPIQMYFGGENIIYTGVSRNSCPTINVESVVRNTVNFLEQKHGAKHYKPYVTMFYREAGISLDERGNPDISIIEDSAERPGAFVGDNLQNPIIYTKVGRKSPTLYGINFGGKCTRNLSGQKKSNYHRPYELSVLGDVREVCRLFRELHAGERRLSHMELFGIATNMVQIQKGEDKFKEILHTQSYYDNRLQKYSKWEQDLRRIKGYKPYSCSEYCPHSGTCPHGKNILSTAKIKYHQMERIANCENNLVDLDEAWHHFKKQFDLAIASEKSGWHIIKCQTAMGKTEVVTKFLPTTQLRVLVSVSTNRLKREVAERFKATGIDFVVSPSLHELKDEMPCFVWDEIEELLNTGKSPLSLINKAIREDDPECAKLFQTYKQEMKAFADSECHAITTHRRLTNMDVSKYDLVIVDEDIIYSTVIPSRGTVSISDLEKLKRKLAASDPLAAKIRKILKKAKKSEFFTLQKIDYRKAYADIKMAVNISALCSAEYFCFRDSSLEDGLDKDCVSFINTVHFSENTKYIMLSATADKNICKYYFGEDNVIFYDCKEARIIGALNQYYDKSMSRSYIKEHPEIFEAIKKWSGFPYTISFKKFEHIYGGDLHYGNCAGCDTLKNENIDVIGTPHQPEWIYKLFAYSLGFYVDCALKPNTKVEYNGCRFLFTTYDDETLRNIQFYMINSEIEQAVGRARLLRCDCTVNLFSNFPIRQANLKESEYDRKHQYT